MSELMVIETGARELDPSQLKQHVSMVSELMRDVLKVNVHYGEIPGCGDRPALFQPGAQKLGMMFNLGPRYKISAEDMGGGHREYEVICELYHRSSGRFVGEGVGVCTTMESKYRYRWDDTGLEVPKEYWNSRDKELLGGPSFTPRKVSGKWKIYQRVEHDNPADYYNTAKKIAKKRAYNDAILTCTAASDIFVPDDDTDPEFIAGDVEQPDDAPPSIQQPRSRSGRAASTQAPEQGKQGDAEKPITEKQAKLLYARLKNAEVPVDEFCHAFELGDIAELPFARMNVALEWIDKRGEE